MRNYTLALVCFGLATILSLARAQSPGAVQQVDSVSQRRAADVSAQKFKDGDTVPELTPGESGDVGPQSVLALKPRKKWFEATADVQFFYTDNLLLTENAKQSDAVLVSTVEFAVAPEAYPLACGNLAPRVGYRHQWFDFGLTDGKLKPFNIPLDTLDFNAQTIFADAAWTHEDWVVDVGFDFTRLMDTSHYDQFYRESVPHWGVQKLFPLCPKTVLAVGYEGDYRVTDSDVPFFFPNRDLEDRMDHGLSVAATYELCKHAIVQPYYRFKYTHFTGKNFLSQDLDRDDYLHSFGVGIYCFFTKQISARVFFAYDIKTSTGRDETTDYNRLDAGGGVNFNIRF